jgi:serine/threonine-protein phosphatase PP1 catalytic subunit
MGLEIVATLLALKLRHPAHVHLLRGNHECSEITVRGVIPAPSLPLRPTGWIGTDTKMALMLCPTSRAQVLFGFCGECQRRSTLAAWEAVMQVFDALPLAALLNGGVFLCHGGISPHLRHPRDINAIARPVVSKQGLRGRMHAPVPCAAPSDWGAAPPART